MAQTNPQVAFKTNLGEFVIELDSQKAPKSTENFLRYVDEKFYDGTIFHRIIEGFMIQGGGFTEKLDQKKTHEPIENEATNGLKNQRGTVAMARTADPHSATSQFFVNVVDNDFLDHKAPMGNGWGYAVVGKVVRGLDVIDAIKALPVVARGPMFQHLPKQTVVVESAKRVTPPAP